MPTYNCYFEVTIIRTLLDSLLFHLANLKNRNKSTFLIGLPEKIYCRRIIFRVSCCSWHERQYTICIVQEVTKEGAIIPGQEAYTELVEKNL